MLGVLITVLGAWVGVSIALAWALGRWFRWLRGDFDPPHFPEKMNPASQDATTRG